MIAMIDWTDLKRQKPPKHLPVLYLRPIWEDHKIASYVADIGDWRGNWFQSHTDNKQVDQAKGWMLLPTAKVEPRNECPNCGCDLQTRATEEMVDEERYKVVRWHYCKCCGWNDYNGSDY